MLKNTSFALMFSLVAIVSVLLGFLAGFLVKQPVTDLTGAFVEERLMNPLEKIIEFNEIGMRGTEPYSSFSFLSGILEELEIKDSEYSPKEMLAYYLEMSLPKMEEYCETFYDLGSAKPDCLNVVVTAKEQISRNIPHNKALNRTP